MIRKGCRVDDIIARLGGDEFVILLPKTDVHEAESLLKRITDLASLEKICGLYISIAFGCNTKSSMDQNIQDVIKNAEGRMYGNKLSENATMRNKALDLVMNPRHESSNDDLDKTSRCSRIQIVLP